MHTNKGYVQLHLEEDEARDLLTQLEMLKSQTYKHMDWYKEYRQVSELMHQLRPNPDE